MPPIGRFFPSACTSLQTRYTDGSYQQDLDYDGLGRVWRETVRIAGAPQSTYVTEFRYDDAHRLHEITYPDGEVVNMAYNGMGLPDTMSSAKGVNAGNAAYDEAARLTSLRLGSGGSALYRTQSYWPWTGTSYKPNGNGLLSQIKVGEDAGSDERLSLLYGYDSFGNVGGLGEEYVDGPNGTHSFDYDDQNRVTNGFGRVYGWRSNGTFSIFAGKTFTYDAYQVRYGVNRVNGHDRYDYDLAGNMTLRRKGTADAQTLSWDGENRLETVEQGGAILARYAYAPDGRRVKVEGGGVTTYVINRYYEVEVADVAYRVADPGPAPWPAATTSAPLKVSGPRIYLPLIGREGVGKADDSVPQALASAGGTSVTIRKNYYFGDQRVAMREEGAGNPQTRYLHWDHFGSILMETYASTGVYSAQRAYHAFGEDRWRDYYYQSWPADPNYFSGGHDISADEWMQHIATLSYADTDFIRSRAVAFWTPRYQAAGIRHAIFNPAPELHEPQNPDLRMPGQSITENGIACAQDFPMGCASATDDIALGIASGGVILCAWSTAGSCLAVAGGAAMVAGGTGAGLSTANWIRGERDVTSLDVAISWTTTSVGFTYGTRGKGVVGVVVSYLQAAQPKHTLQSRQSSHA